MAGDTLPEPFVPSDVSLSDFRFMPLEVARLRRSKAWLMAKRKPELGFYMINLWTAAWHEIPAGSLEDDDDVLADAAMCVPRKWQCLKAEILHGWVKCADGRLYHPTVAEKANEAWAAKQNKRQRTEAARQAKLQKQSQTVENKPTEPVTISVTDNVTGSKGREGKGQGEGRDSSVPNGTGAVAPADPVKSLFDTGVSILTASGTPDKQARSLLGKWRKELADDEALMAIITSAAKNHAVEPVSYIAKAVGDRNKPPSVERLFG